MKAKDIIQVSSYYPPHLGGQEYAVYDLAKQLANAGHPVRVLTSVLGAGTKGTCLEDGIVVSRLWGFVLGHAPIMPWFPVMLFRAAQADSVVHLHIGQAFTPEMVCFISKLLRFKYIAQLHIDFEPSGPAGKLLPLYKRLILKRVLHSAAAVITLNEKTRDLVRNVYGYTGNLQMLNNGIDESYFNIRRQLLPPTPPAVLCLLFVGRLSKQKNIATLLKALKKTKRQVHVDLVGDGELRESIEKTIISQQLTNVTLHGRLKREDVLKFYRTCDALIMPSLYEAQPLVLLEAMAARIPIIGTNVVGVAEHIKDAGIIVEPTAGGLAGGIEQYYKRYTQLPKMLDRGYELAEKLRWTHTLKKYVTLYEKVAGD